MLLAFGRYWLGQLIVFFLFFSHDPKLIMCEWMLNFSLSPPVDLTPDGLLPDNLLTSYATSL